MRNQLRFLTLAAILGCAVYVVAQIGAPPRSGQGTQVASKSGGSYLTRSRKVAEPRERPTILQDALQSYMIAKLNYTTTMAESEGLNSRVDAIIQAHGYWRLTTMLPDQQQAEIHNVWEIDAWAPNGNWQQIAKAPSLVMELLKVSPGMDKKIEAIREANPNANIQANDRMMDRLMADPKFRALSRDEKNKIIYAENQKFLASKTKVERVREYMRSEEAIANGVVKLLTPAQKREWDSFISGYERDIRSAYQTGTSSVVKS